MNEITFKRTANPFLNVGIISLHHYLIEYRNNKNIDESALMIGLFENQLVVKCVAPLELLEILDEVYCIMGRDIYDTSGKKALEKVDKYFFIETPFEAVPFAKMKTYGLGELITNDATPIASKKGKKIKFERLLKENEELANKIASFLDSKGKKLKFFSFIDNILVENETVNGKRKENAGGESEIFLDAGYTKTPELENDPKLFEVGNQTCYLTGVQRKKLVSLVNNTPFSNFSNFSSFLDSGDKKVSWEVSYLIKFSPKYCFYMYVSGLDSLVCYMFESDNLLHLREIYNIQKEIFKGKNELEDDNYMSNFKIHQFSTAKKDAETRTTGERDYAGQYEVLFMLLYTFYKKVFSKETSEAQDFMSFMEDSQKIPLANIISFRADKFAATLRPNSFENFNNFQFIIRLIGYLERQKVTETENKIENFKFSDLMYSLKFQKPSEKSSQNSYQLERKIRNTVLRKILKKQSILSDIENLFYKCFISLNSSENVGFKNYKLLLQLVNFYEPIINNSMEKEQMKNLQEKAIKLGTSIGYSITQIEEGDKNDKQSNARQARKYIIGLHKARTFEQFREAIIRIQKRYGLVVSGELLDGMSESTFEFIKQFAVISALNQINYILRPQTPVKQ